MMPWHEYERTSVSIQLAMSINFCMSRACAPSAAFWFSFTFSAMPSILCLAAVNVRQSSIDSSVSRIKSCKPLPIRSLNNKEGRISVHTFSNKGYLHMRCTGLIKKLNRGKFRHLGFWSQLSKNETNSGFSFSPSYNDNAFCWLAQYSSYTLNCSAYWYESEPDLFLYSHRDQNFLKRSIKPAIFSQRWVIIIGF